MESYPRWKQELREVFERFDRDANGRIDRVEFDLLLDALGSDLSDGDRDIGFALVDADESGSIDFEELAEWWQVVREEGQ